MLFLGNFMKTCIPSYFEAWVMLAAHGDKIGFKVTLFSDEGFIGFVPVWLYS
jgi:putative aminopeptidase FrvX